MSEWKVGMAAAYGLFVWGLFVWAVNERRKRLEILRGIASYVRRNRKDVDEREALANEIVGWGPWHGREVMAIIKQRGWQPFTPPPPPDWFSAGHAGYQPIATPAKKVKRPPRKP